MLRPEHLDLTHVASRRRTCSPSLTILAARRLSSSASCVAAARPKMHRDPFDGVCSEPLTPNESASGEALAHHPVWIDHLGVVETRLRQCRGRYVLPPPSVRRVGHTSWLCSFLSGISGLGPGHAPPRSPFPAPSSFAPPALPLLRGAGGAVWLDKHRGGGRVAGIAAPLPGRRSPHQRAPARGRFGRGSCIPRG